MIEERVTEFEERTVEFALNIINLFTDLRKSAAGEVIGRQILRSGTSVGAHVAEANQSKSAADFINKIMGARQEVQETLYWLKLIERAGLMTKERVLPLRQEAIEIKAILVTMATRAKRRTSD